MKVVILGLAITSSWGNGHATTYRSLVRALAERGHDVLFLERNAPWYASNRDLESSEYCTIGLYDSLTELHRRFRQEVGTAELVIVGSYVPDGVEVASWVFKTRKEATAFYDIDTPVTLTALERGQCEYLSREVIGQFDFYLSFTGGAQLDRLETVWGARQAVPFYCSVDPEFYYPEPAVEQWDLGYLGTYSPDRQPGVERLLIEPARMMARRRFVVAGPQYPPDVPWPQNVSRVSHLAPADHRRFYNSQRFTLNLTRAAMIRAGHSPSVRLFEAAACGVPIITDSWKGIEDFFEPGKEILIASHPKDVRRYLNDVTLSERKAIGARARARVLSEHTAMHRAIQLEDLVHGLGSKEPFARVLQRSSV